MIVNAAALLEALPLMVGYHPSRAMAFAVLNDHATVSPIGVAPCPEGWDPGFAPVIDQAVAQNGAAVILVSYQDDHATARAALEVAAADIHAPILYSLYTDGAHWWDLADPTPQPMPTEPTSDLALNLITSGATAAPNRAAVTARIAAPADHETEHLLGLMAQAQAATNAHDEPRALLRSLVAKFTAETAAMDGIFPTDEDALTLAALVSDLDRRDVAWLLMNRTESPAHCNLWQHVVSRTPRTHAAGPLALYGFASWLTGNGSGTNDAITVLTEHHPDYSMGHLLAELMDRQVPPTLWDEPGLQAAAHNLMAD